MSQIIFGHDQKNAISMATNWYKSCEFINKPYFIITGYAGSGKSTVLSQILYNMKIPFYKIAFVTYTGKAAVVLRNKGLPAITIHKFIYNVSITKSGKPIFHRKNHISGNVELICIDEIGMVPQQMLEDLLSFNIPILGLGDPGQLPPIFGENNFILNPDCTLTEVYRQKNGSSLLQIATDIRNGINPYTKTYDSDVKIITAQNFNMKSMPNFDQILCSMNNTKMKLNVSYRNIFNYKSAYPQINEKIICTKNNFKDVILGKNGVDMFMVNGMQVNTSSNPIHIIDNIMSLKFVSDYTQAQSQIYCNETDFSNNYEDIGFKLDDAPDDNVMEFFDNKVINHFDYGYAITVHKSQGSEWDNVLVFDDCFYREEDKYQRWLYTAVTRAKKSLTIVRVTR